jgi:hypothetical protein
VGYILSSGRPGLHKENIPQKKKKKKKPKKQKTKTTTKKNEVKNLHMGKF